MRQCFVLIILCALPAFAWTQDPEVMHPATPEELAMKNVSFEPGAPAAILEWEHYQDDTDGYAKEYVRIKVFTAEGVKYGNVEAQFQDGFSHIRGLEARTIHADGTVIPFNGQTYEKVLMKDAKGGISAMTFSLPDVQPGSIIEYRFIRAWSRTRFLDRESWDVQRELPIVKERLWFKPYREVYQSFFRYQGVPKQMNPVREHFELEMENVPSFQREPFSPPDSHLVGRVDFRYTDPFIDMDNYWRDTGKTLSREVERAIASAGGAAASTFVAGATSDEDKLRKIYAHVQELELPHDEMNRTFVALARGLGFPAYVVRAADREDTVFSHAPDASQLTDDLAVVTVSGKDRYFDPGTRFTPFGQLRWSLAGAYALTLMPKTQAKLITTPLPAFSDALVHRVADLHIDGEVVKGTLTVTWDGQSALVRRQESAGDPEATAKLALESEVREWLPEGSRMKLTSAGPLQSIAPLVATFDVEMPNAASFTGSRVLLPLSIFAAAVKNPFAAEQRQNMLDFQYPRTIADEVTLHLPEGYTIESVPENVTNDRKAFVYKSEWQKDASAVTLKRTFIINAIQIDRKLYGQVRDFWAKALSVDAEPLVLKKPAAPASE